MGWCGTEERLLSVTEIRMCGSFTYAVVAWSVHPCTTTLRGTTSRQSLGNFIEAYWWCTPQLVFLQVAPYWKRPGRSISPPRAQLQAIPQPKVPKTFHSFSTYLSISKGKIKLSMSSLGCSRTQIRKLIQADAITLWRSRNPNTPH